MYNPDQSQVQGRALKRDLSSLEKIQQRNYDMIRHHLIKHVYRS